MRSGRLALSGKLGFSFVELLAVIALVAILLLFTACTAVKTVRRPPSSVCANNFKQLGQSLLMYSSESVNERFPRQGYYYSEEVDCNAMDAEGVATYPAANPGTKESLFKFMFSMDDMYPDYLPDVTVLVCPSDATFTKEELVNPVTGELDISRHCSQEKRGVARADSSYIYQAHYMDKCDEGDCLARSGVMGAGLALFCADDLIDSDYNMVIMPDMCVQFGAWFDEVVMAVATKPETFEARLDEDWDLAETAAFDVGEVCADFEFPGNGNTNTLFRLREGLESLVGAGDGDIAVLWEQVTVDKEDSNHNAPHGGNVLYMDGHVDYVEYPGRSPMSIGYVWATECIRSGTGM